MKASRTAKIERQLQDSEESLRSQLALVLPRVAASGESLFFNSHYLPPGFLEHWLPREAEPLFVLASECIDLRERLSLPTAGSLPDLYLSACDESFQSTNEHRRGPRQLAASLLPLVAANAA